MRAFAELVDRLDATTSTRARTDALADWFGQVPPREGAWALWILTGQKLPRLVRSTDLRRWAADHIGMPDWLFEECYATVGDLAETIALLVDQGGNSAEEEVPLHVWMEDRLPALRGLDAEGQQAMVRRWWEGLTGRGLFVVGKLLTGGWRIGVARTLVERGLAQAAGVDSTVITARLMGQWTPSASLFEGCMAPGTISLRDPSQPLPFFLASPLEGNPEDTLGAMDGWYAEWKWDGIRGQLVRRQGRTWLWSRGEELVTERYPELEALGEALPDGTVLDGEILAWRDGRPAPFADLQHRIGRKKPGRAMVARWPIVFMAWDVLEWGGLDRLQEPLEARRAHLEGWLAARGEAPAGLEISTPLAASSWQDLAALRQACRAHAAEGLMLKRRGSPYRAGRRRGDWWKWKIEPMTFDGVLLYAQVGHGRRANLYTDYTFGVWEGDTLVPIAKAYSGLTDEEIRKVDHWVRRHTREKFGPVRSVEAGLVFEVGFEGIAASTRHKAGLAVRFPRMLRWRTDKAPADADTLEQVRRWLDVCGAHARGDAEDADG